MAKKKYTQAELQALNRNAISYFDQLLKELDGNVSDDNWGALNITNDARVKETENVLEMPSSMDASPTPPPSASRVTSSTPVDSSLSIYDDDESTSYTQKLAQKAREQEQLLRMEDEPVAPVPSQRSTTLKPTVAVVTPSKIQQPMVEEDVFELDDDEEPVVMEKVEVKHPVVEVEKEQKVAAVELPVETKMETSPEIKTSETTAVSKPKIDPQELLKKWRSTVEPSLKSAPVADDKSVELQKQIEPVAVVPVSVSEIKKEETDEFESLLNEPSKDMDIDDDDKTDDDWEVTVEKD